MAEAFGAVGALEGPFAGMDAAVFHQVVFEFEFLAALGAFEAPPEHVRGFLTRPRGAGGGALGSRGGGSSARGGSNSGEKQWGLVDPHNVWVLLT